MAGTNLKVDIEGLKLLKNSLANGASTERLVPEMSLAVLQFHNVLEKRVGEVFTLRTPLSSYLIGKSVKPSAQGKTFLKYSLQYRSRPEPLSNFKYSLKASGSTSLAPVRVNLNFVKNVSGKFSTEIHSEVRKGKEQLVRRKRGSPLKGFHQKGKIYARKQKKTWIERPYGGSDGERAPIQMLFGPRASLLASKVFDNDPQVKQHFRYMEEKILKSFIEFYR